MTGALFTRILCPVDLPGTCMPALRVSRCLAERNGATLALIHVMTPAVPGGVVLRQEREDARAALEKMVESELDGIPCEIIVCWGNPAREILAAQAQVRADLCVIPNDGALGRARFFGRSIAEKVALRSSCPVLTINSRGRSANGR